LCRAAFSPQPELVEPIFYVRFGVRILTIHVGEFRDKISKLETFEMHEFENVRLFEFHRNGTFQFYMLSFIVFPASFADGNPKFSHNSSIRSGCSWTRFGVSWESETPSG
jgi:hypothetical protein